jgi:DnaK suppressor protein
MGVEEPPGRGPPPFVFEDPEQLGRGERGITATKWRCKTARKDALFRLHSRLVARRDALHRALNGDLEGFRQFAAMNDVGDNADAAVDTANDEISLQLVEIDSRELGRIEHALQRIVEGVYGRCEFCNGKIAEARLNALPYTSTCIDCQRENERNGQAFGAGAEDIRWARIYDTPSDDHDNDSDVNFRDFEMEISESGR